MRIAVMSDTHLPRFGRSLPEPLVRAIDEAGVERVLHLGDWTSMLAVDVVASIGLQFDGVAGNNDPPELVERFGRSKVLEIEGVRIGLTHGDLGKGATSRDRAVSQFAPEVALDPRPVDVILFGHSHIPHLEPLPDGGLLVNPGSPTDKRRQPRFSWAVLDLSSGRADAELRLFDR